MVLKFLDFLIFSSISTRDFCLSFVYLSSFDSYSNRHWNNIRLLKVKNVSKERRKDRDRKTETERQRQKDRDRKTETERQRLKDRGNPNDNKTERQRNPKDKKQKDKRTKRELRPLNRKSETDVRFVEGGIHFFWVNIRRSDRPNWDSIKSCSQTKTSKYKVPIFCHFFFFVIKNLFFNLFAFLLHFRAIN